MQGMVRTLRSSLEESGWRSSRRCTPSCRGLQNVHGSCARDSRLGRDGKTAHERLEGKSAKVQVLMFGEGVSWKWKRRGSPLGKLTRMWEDGVCLGVKGTTGDIIVGTRRRVVHEDGQEKAREKDCGSSWRMNEDDPETDGVKLQEEIEITDKDHKEKFSFPSTTRSWGN